MMLALVKRPFAETFTLARASAGAHRDATGALVTAPANAPRFDHDENGTPRGLLVEGGAPGEADRLASVDGWAAPGPATVLHEFEADGVIVRSARYTVNVKATVDGCLRAAVHHREIKALPAYLRNRGGYVRHDGRNWPLSGTIAVQAAPFTLELIEDGHGRPVLDG